MRQFVYCVNHLDLITYVDANWLQFASENGFAQAETVIGRSLWDYVGDMTTHHLYHVFLARVRKTRLPVRVPFRCDAPDRRRYMQLVIHWRPEGLKFQSTLLREERREPVTLLDHTAPRDSRILTMCVWCKKVKAAVWQDVEDAVRDLSLFSSERLPMISHVTCPDCQSSGLQSLVD